MIGAKDATNFFDSLLVEYQCNQVLLTQKSEKRSLPVAKEADDRLAKLFKVTIGQKDRELHTKLLQSAQNRELSFVLPKSHQHLLQLDRSADQAGFFDRELHDEVTRKIAPVLSAFEQRVRVAFTTFEDYRLKLVMGELMLQALMRAQSGVHLFIVSEDLKLYIDESMSATYWRGVYTAFKVLVKDPSLHDQLLAKVFDLLQQSLNWKVPNNWYKIDYTTIQAILRLLALFPPYKMLEYLQHRKTLFNQQVCLKLKTAITQHLRYGTATKMRAELVATFDEVLAFLGDNDSFAKQLLLLRNRINRGIDDPTNLIGHTLVDCVKSPDFGCRHLNVLCAYYLLASKICAINPSKAFSENNREYPSTENLLAFVKNIPHQLRGEATESSAKIVITTAQALENKRSDELQALLDRPVRSFFCHGYNITSIGEWKLLCKWKEKIEAEIKQRYPQEPAPFRALFTEQFTEF